MNLEEYKRLKKKVEDLQRESNRAEGKLKGLMDRLEEEQGCTSLKEADVKVTKIQEKLEKLEKSFDTALEKFKDKWGDKLDESD